MVDSNRWNRLFSFIFVTVVGVFGGPKFTEAGAMTPWSGASASAWAVNASQTSSGATAAASKSGTTLMTYQSGGFAGEINPGHVYSTQVQGSSEGEATSSPGSLLHLSSAYYAGNPGTRPIQVDSYLGSTGSSASWSNDSVQISSPSGLGLPDQIRLNFGISMTHVSGFTFDDQAANSNPAIDLVYNDVHTTLHGLNEAAYSRDPSDMNHLWSGGWSSRPMGDVTLDSWTKIPQPGDMIQPSGGSGTFHIDLAVDALGRSQPFSVSVSSAVNMGLISNTSIFNSLKDLTISLDSITLPDGTSVTDAGYGVSFASGMAWPQPNAVPEPASVVVWTGLAAAGWWGVRKKRRMA